MKKNSEFGGKDTMFLKAYGFVFEKNVYLQNEIEIIVNNKICRHKL